MIHPDPAVVDRTSPVPEDLLGGPLDIPRRELLIRLPIEIGVVDEEHAAPGVVTVDRDVVPEPTPERVPNPESARGGRSRSRG